MKKMKESHRNTLVIITCILSLVVLFTIDGYVEYREEQRSKLLCNQQEIDKDLTDYFLKGINPSY